MERGWRRRDDCTSIITRVGDALLNGKMREDHDEKGH